jgi:hypothetical protein
MPRMKKQNEPYLFTWEEVSWITGVPVVMLLEIFAHSAEGQGLLEADLPPSIDVNTLVQWLQSNPGLVREVA